MAELNLKETLDRHHSNVNAETNNEPQLDVQTCLSQVITRVKIMILTMFILEIFLLVIMRSMI